MSTSPCQMVWASVLAFSCIIIMLAVLLSVPFCMARVPFVNRLVGKLAQLMDVAPPVPNTHVMKGEEQHPQRPHCLFLPQTLPGPLQHTCYSSS